MKINILERLFYYKFFLLVFAFLILNLGCSKKELKEQISILQSEVDNLEQENKSLKSQLKNVIDLEKDLERMRTKIDSVSQLPGTLYSKAHSYFENEDYKDCMTLLILISEKYPDWDKKKVENKYKLAYKKQVELEKENERLAKIEDRKKKREAQLVESIKNNVEISEDKEQGITYYKTIRPTICQIGHTISFGVELYMVKDKYGKKIFRLKSTYFDKSGSDYHSPQWMNYNEIELVSDKGSRIVIDIDESNKELEKSKFLRKEMSDNLIETDKILNFHGSNKVRVYFKGKYFYEFDLTYDQFNAFREILANYDYI